MPPNACAPSGPRTEHTVPPERTESATASERYAARHPTETAISGQAPSVARREPASTRRVQRPREPARYAPSEGGQEDPPPRSERRPPKITGGGMQPDGRATHRRPCRFHEPARTAAGCPGRESGTGEKHSARREQDAPLRCLIACAAPRSTPLGAGNPNPAGSDNLPPLPQNTSKAADVIAMKLGISETRDEPGCAPVSATRWPRRRTAATADCRPTSAGCWRPGCSTFPAMRSEPVSS